MTAVDPIVVEVTEAPISVTVASTGLVLSVASGTVGPAGAQGPAGTNGQGVPTGGTTGQVLAKKTGTNYDTEWVDQSGGGGGGSGTVTEVTGTAPISVATGTTTPVVSIAAATTSAAGSMSAADKTKLDGLAAVATSGAHGDLTGLTTGDPHTQYQRSESVYTSASSYTVTDESTVVSTGSTVVLPSAQAQAGRTVLVGAGADVTVTCAGTDVFLDGIGSTTFLVRTGNGVGFTSVDAGGTWGWAIVTRQGSTYDLPSWAGQSLAEGKVLRIDGTGAPAWANVAAADVPSLAASKITSGTFDTARLASTGTADATTFLRGDGSWAAPAATVADGAVTTAKIADGAVTSAKIADGSIVDADVSASAAIAASKISGLTTVATSGSASDLSTGTVPSARLSTKAVGGQGAGSQVNEPSTATSLLTSTVTVPVCAEGDVLLFSAGINLVQNSGASRNVTFAVKLGATTMLSMVPAITASATTRVMHIQGAIRVNTTSSQSGSMIGNFVVTTAGNNAVGHAATGTATENLASASTFDLLVTATNNTTQNYTLQYLNVTKVAA